MYNLDDLYLGFDDSQFTADLSRLEQLLQQLENLPLAFEQQALKEVILKMEEIQDLSRSLMAFCGLNTSADTANKEANRYQYQLSQLFSNHAQTFAKIEKYFGSLEDVETLITGDEILESYRFFFEEA